MIRIAHRAIHVIDTALRVIGWGLGKVSPKLAMDFYLHLEEGRRRGYRDLYHLNPGHLFIVWGRLTLEVDYNEAFWSRFLPVPKPGEKVNLGVSAGAR